MKKLIFIFIVPLFAFSSCATRVIAPSAAPAKKVVIVKKASYPHNIVYIQGKKYYRWNGKYHRKTARGMVLVKI